MASLSRDNLGRTLIRGGSRITTVVMDELNGVSLDGAGDTRARTEDEGRVFQGDHP